MDEGSFARVGVVVVTHASAVDVVDTLPALPTAALARVVVVDNGSPDETVAVVRAMKLPNVEVLEQANLGFGAGNDAGRQRLPGETELVLFLNPDCVIERHDIARLVAYLDEHPRCALVGPSLRGDEGPATSAGSLPTPLSELQPHLPRLLGRLITRRQHPPEASRSGPVGYVEGACMLSRLVALDEVGGFDHRYFLCFEEMDLARRLSDAGWTVDLCAEASAHHVGSSSRSQAPLFSQFHKYRSQRAYLERWYGNRAARRYARLARTAWWIRFRLGRLGAGEYRVLAAAVAGDDFPS